MKKIIHGTILALLLLLNGMAFAQTPPTTNGYAVLAPLPNIPAGTPTTLSTYLPVIFNLAIGVGAIAAFVVITIYGFEYMLSDSLNTKLKAKEMLTNTLWGLGLIIFAWVILNTINPALLKGTLNLVTPAIAPGGGLVAGAAGANVGGNVAGVAMTQAQIDASNAMRSSLLLTGVKAYAGPCTQGQTTGCVDLNGLTLTTQNDLALLRSSCGTCNVVISGGTEAGHSVGSDHNAGTGVDILPDQALNSAVTNNFANGLAPCQKYTPPSGGTYMWEPAGSSCGGTVASTADHWHASF